MRQALRRLLLPAIALGVPHSVYAEGAVVLRLSQERLGSFPSQVLEGSSYRADNTLNGVTPKVLQTAGASLNFSPPAYMPQWDFEVFMAQTTRLSGSAGTFAALNALAGDRSLHGTGAPLPLSVTGQLMQRRGLGATRTFLPRSTDWGDLSVRAGLRVFNVNRFRSIDASGMLLESRSGVQQLQATTQDFKLGGTSPFINPQVSLGTGLALNLQATLGSQERNHLTLSVADFGPPVSLAHVLQTQQTVNTNTLSHDASGYAQFAPALRGNYSDVSYKAKQYPSYGISGAMLNTQTMQWIGRMHYTYPVAQYAGGASWRISQKQQIQGLLHYTPQMPASASLSWQHPLVTVLWRGDRLSPTNAKIWQLEGQLNF